MESLTLLYDGTNYSSEGLNMSRLDELIKATFTTPPHGRPSFDLRHLVSLVEEVIDEPSSPSETKEGSSIRIRTACRAQVC